MTGRNTSGDMLAALRGASATVYLAMVLRYGSHTIRSLEIATGYTYKPVRAALTSLEQDGLVQFDDQANAWQLAAGAPLLHQLGCAAQIAEQRLSQKLSTDGLDPAGESPVQSGESLERVGESTINPTVYAGTSGDTPAQCGESSIPTSTRPDPNGESPVSNGEDPISACVNGGGENYVDDFQPANMTVEKGKSPILNGEKPIQVEEKTIHYGEYPGQSGESPTQSGESPDPAPVLTTTNSDKDNKTTDLDIVSSKQARNMTVPEWLATLEETQREVARWLLRGGIGRQSPKMRELLAAGLDLEVVKAHVLDWQACKAGLVERKDYYYTGLLIRNLLDRDPPPPLRCEECLRLPNQAGLCGCDYAALIQR